jgi:hypothetical protein
MVQAPGAKHKYDARTVRAFYGSLDIYRTFTLDKSQAKAI